MFTLSTFTVLLFVTLVFGMAGLTVLAIGRAGSVDNEPLSTTRRRTIITCVGLVFWLGIPFTLAKKGILADFSHMPSPFMKMLFAFTFLTVMLSAVSPLGERLAKGFSLHALFGFQVFRVMIEILLMLFHKQGLAPVQMTIEGRNWDLITGLLALVMVAFFKNKPLSKSTYTFLNLIGLGFVINVVAVGFLSLPTPFQVFPGDNTWITTASFVWLPTFLVELAIAGHVISFRKILIDRKAIHQMEITKAKQIPMGCSALGASDPY